MTLPLTLWQLQAQSLPDEMTSTAHAFVLPGAQALDDFADLLGTADSGSASGTEPALPSAPFSLPAMLPQDIEGPVFLRREIDFGALRGDRAVLTLDHLCGSGRILLGERMLCAFDSARLAAESLCAALSLSAQPCMLAADLTDALALGRRETLTIEFDGVRPAGLPGPVLLHVTQHAHLSRLDLTPSVREQSVCVHAQIHALRAGRYVLRAQAVAADGAPDPAQEVSFTLGQDGCRDLSFSLPLPAEIFVPSMPYAASAVKVQLFLRPENTSGEGRPCDSAVLLCGYRGKAPQAWLPIRPAETGVDPQELAAHLRALGVPAISLHVPAADSVYRALCRAGIAVRQVLPADHPLRSRLLRLPNVFLTDIPDADRHASLEASAWQLCSMISTPRRLDETLTAQELLAEASGLTLHPGNERVKDVLLWLRAVSVRLRAEAARQGRFDGALCHEGEWETDDVAQALSAAFAPTHLFALPLCGAWWTTARFSASIQAFIPKDLNKKDAPLTARVILEDENGHALAQLRKSCPSRGGFIGVIEAALPDRPCVLELTTQLLLGDDLLEESTLPVYVGERGPLEAAFGTIPTP